MLESCSFPQPPISDGGELRSRPLPLIPLEGADRVGKIRCYAATLTLVKKAKARD